jgi:hypothetical protein
MRRGIVAVILGMVASVLVGEPRAGAQLVTFENFSQGFPGSWFVGPMSGILFTNPVYNLPGGVFSVDYGGPANPPVLPGNHLNGNEYGTGPGLGLKGGFGFKTYPRPASAAWSLKSTLIVPDWKEVV